MPSVYDYRHVELDNIGRGKRVLNPPGGVSNEIFGGANGSMEVSSKNPTISLSSLSLSENIHFSRLEVKNRRKSDSTQDRLFGHAKDVATPKKVVDRMKSNIFSDEVVTPSSTSASSTKYVRRNPITGAVMEESVGTPGLNGHTSRQGNSFLNGTPPGTGNARVRSPPGGKSSGIF